MLIRESAPRAKLLRLVKWCPTLVTVFLLSLLVPTDLSFYLGPLRLTLYRVVLLVAIFPAVKTVFSGRVGRVNIIDWLVIVNCAWSLFVIGYYHELDTMLKSGGIRVVEFAGAYFLGRAYITNERTYQGVVAVVIMVILLILPFAIFESVTGFNIIRKFASGGAFSSPIDQRMGFTRAFGPFDHPILLGVFSACVMSIAWLRVFPRMGSPKPRKTLAVWVALTALCSLSSGATSSLGAQFVLLLWEAKTRLWRRRWLILFLIIVMFYFIIDVLSTRSAMIVLLSYLTFSPGTAWGRIQIFDWGMADVYRHPIMGIGFNEWTRPWWKSASMDNFWLLEAVTYGIPGFVTFVLPAILAIALGWRTLSPRLTRLRTGWAISMSGLIIAGATVHFWNNTFVFYSFILGIGVWFVNARRGTSVEQGSAATNYRS